MVTQELAARLWDHPSCNMIGDVMSSIALTADCMAADIEDEFSSGQLAKCDQVLRFIDQDWQAYRSAVAELRNELSDRLTHR